jgi:hypothetical protein
VYIVFLPMLGADDVETAAERAAEFTDQRLTCYWDTERAAALAWQHLYALDKPAWDMYFLYDTEAVWNDDITMPVVAWTGHQPIGDKIQKMDMETFAARAKNLAKQ